jgi:cytochrome c peroxidase
LGKVLDCRAAFWAAFGCCSFHFASVAVASQPAPAGTAYAWHLPPGFPVPFVPADNPMSPAKVALGCRLFFDTRLSSTRTYSCASCHRPELAFTDGRAHAIGATGDVVRRGAMTLTNVAYNTAYTWASNQAVSLEAQMAQPLFNEHPLEMGLKRGDPSWVNAFSADGYSEDFQQAFPEDAAPVSAGNVIKAIATFERTLISGRSAFDRYVFDDDRAALSPQAQRGMALFFSKRVGCATCHFGVNFSGAIQRAGRALSKPVFANTDVTDRDVNAPDLLADGGLGELTHRQQDLGKFRVPTLRNVALMAPYMHDGSIATLAAVIDHYAQGGRQLGRGRNVAIRPVTLSDAEKQELIAFLSGLTDEEFVERSKRLEGITASPSVDAPAPSPLPATKDCGSSTVAPGEKSDPRIR